MKYTNEDLTNIKDDVVGSIEIAISELEGVEEYKNILEQLEQIKSDLEEEAEPYEEAYEEECRQNKIYDITQYNRDTY